MAASQDNLMKEVLENAGLNPDKWLQKFKGIGATNVAALNECGEESFDSLKKYIKTRLEEKVLKRFLKLDPSKQTPDEEMKAILNKSGLDPEKWIEVFKKVHICTPEALNKCSGKELYKSIEKSAKTELEKKMLQDFLKLDSSSEITTKTPEEGMSEILENAGLEPKYWLPKFTEEPLGIKTPQALKQCGPEVYKSLSKHAKTEFHEKTLKSFLGMNEKESAFRQQQKNEIKNHSDKLQKTITDLKALRNNEKERNDTVVQALEDSIRTELKVPSEKWISPKADINSLLTQLESYESKLSGIVANRKDYDSSKELINQISNGHILRGLVPIQHMEPKGSDNLLLRSYDGLQVKGPTLDPETKTETFTSVLQEDSYVKNIDKVALSSSIAAKGGVVFAVEVSASASYKNEKEKLKKEQEERTYLSKVENTIVPLGCFTFSDTNLVLSSTALTHLQKIEDQSMSSEISQGELQLECETFFTKFGSCANCGPYHLGGMYWLKSTSEGFKKDEMEELEEQHSKALSFSASALCMSVGGSVSASAAHATGMAEGKHMSESKTTIKISQGQHGGPPEAVGMKIWKDGLMASNSTWQIIGKEMNLIYIWEIIKLNHSGDFKNVEKLSQLLSQAWEHLIHSSLNHKWQEYLHTTPEAVKLLESVKLWLSSQKESDCLDNLNMLLERKQSLQHNESSYWLAFYLNQTSIQCYLRWIVFVHQQKQTSSDVVRHLMQKVVEYDELVKVKNLHDRWYVLGWLYPLNSGSDESSSALEDNQCTDVSSFLKFLETTIEECRYSEIKSTIKGLESGEITDRLRKAVSILCNDTSYDSLLLVTLLLPLEYDIESRYFKNDLTLDHLIYLKNKLREYETSSLEKPNTLSSHAKLFLQALQTDGTFNKNITESMLIKHIQYLQSKIENLDSSVVEALTKSQLQSSNRYNFRQLKMLLNELTCQSQLHTPEQESEVANETALPRAHRNRAVKPKDKEYEKFLHEVHFLDYFPQQLTLHEALLIDCDMDKFSETSDLKDLLWVILQKIKMSNYNGRNVTNKVTNSSCVSDDADPFDIAVDPFETPIDPFDTSDDNTTTSNTDNSTHQLKVDDKNVSYDTILIHPMDSLLALLHCSNNFLKHFLFQKLITAQLAVPLLAPDPVTGDLEVPLWSLRSIVRYWKSKEEGISREARIIDLEIPLISFMRFSHPQTYSKSALLNKLISQSFTHNFFFNIDCNNSSAERKFANGMVEACWYLPSGKESDHFNDVITFANLRGNAGIYSKQLEFLSFHSYMSYISLAEEDIQRYGETIKKLRLAKGNVIFLMKNCSKVNERVLKGLVPRSYIICLITNGKIKQPADLVKEIRSLIKMRLLKQKSPFCKISTCCDSSEIQSELGIFTDEVKSKPCKRGKELADEIMKEVQRFSPEEVKEKVVPLQSPSLWHQWATLDKKENRMKSDEMGEEGIEQFKKKKRDGKIEIRKKQVHEINKSNRSKVISIFIDVLCYEKQEVRSYFLQWLKCMLDDNSRKVLPRFQRQCKETRAKLRNKDLKAEQKEKLSQELQKYDKELIHASFGVEHLFREIGQMYECVMELRSHCDKELTTKVTMLCKVAAHLLHSGYPLEIIDGDAAHIPLKWVSDILKIVNTFSDIKGSQIYILSVLGIQSTGKSTLLNTVYGAQFAVSAGRCTRGASCQLLKVKSSPSEPRKHMLIIDTEGLRAPELDSQQTQQHDNELATLVIGLAGATIVNISGEVPADINDILQTSVHAFMRMKNVELKPSCQFVRHHVVDAAAGGSNEGSQRFQQTLDEMTVLAAKAERCDGQYQFFNEVITFDNTKDIQNFAGLWEGNPPMAPVNPAYCEDSVKLKSKILQFFVSSDTLCSIHEFDLRLSKLWESVLGENFIFSFKNTLEVEAYAKLDAEYGTKWSWRLQNLMLKWQRETRKFITSATDGDIENTKKNQVRKIEDDLDKEFDSIQIDFIKFFEENPNSYLAARMEQWRAIYHNKLDNLRNDHKSSAPRFCQELINKKLAKKKVESMRKTERDRINRKIKELVGKVDIDKDKKLTDNDIKKIKKKFNESWERWMADLKMQYSDPEKSKINIEQEILHCIRRRCGLQKEDPVINKEVKHCAIRDRGRPLQLILDRENHLNFALSTKLIAVFTQKLKLEKVSAAEVFTSNTLLEIKSDLDKHDCYSDNIIPIVVQKIINKVNTFEKENNIGFTTLYLVEMVLEVAGYAFHVFNRLQEEAIEDHPVTYLGDLKHSYETTFTALCTATAQEKASALCLTDLVFKQVQLALIEELANKLADDVKSNNSIFDSKKVLKGQILLKLLKEQKYHFYDDYLQNVRKSYLYWIRRYVKEYCLQSKPGKPCKIVLLAKQELTKIVAKVETAAEKASEVVVELKTKGQQIENMHEHWMKTFHTELAGRVLTLNEQELHDITQLQPDSDLEFFKDEFIAGVKQREKEYSESFEKPEQSKILKLETLINDAGEIIRDSIAGCCEQCPFCKEQCDKTDSKHEGFDHSCSLHRPQCLGGYRYVDSGEMIIDICTTKVGGGSSFKCNATNNEYVPYKKYRTIYPDWQIGDEARASAPYWKWFTATYKDRIVKSFDFKPVSLSTDWTCLTPSDAEDDIRKRYGLK